MKKLLLIAFVAFAFNSSFAQVKDNAIKINLFGILGGQYQLAYERAISEKFSVQLSAGYISTSSSQTIGTNKYSSKNTGFIIIPEVRYYFIEGLKGPYIAGFLRYRGVTENLTDESVPMNIDVSRKSNVTTIGGGAVFGYQVLISDVMALDFFLGPQFKDRSSTENYTKGGSDEDFRAKFIKFKVADKSGVGIRFGISLGIAF